MDVLSLFNGISCGNIALDRAGIQVGNYFSSEIDKYANKVTQKNYPNTIQLGDIKEVKAKDLPKIDLLIGGSPCQGFSFAGKQFAFGDPRSALFFEYLRILKEIKKINPDVKFLLENVRMKKQYLDAISELLGVEPICINSSLVCAQNRVRYYWTNIPNVEQPKDRKIKLEDVLDCGSNEVYQRGRGNNKGGVRVDKSPCMGAHSWQENVKALDIREKSKCVRASGRGSYDRHEWDSVDKKHLRKLTVTECERLQTVPENYTACVSNTQRYKMLGNGWTVDVIAHIFKYLKTGD